MPQRGICKIARALCERAPQSAATRHASGTASVQPLRSRHRYRFHDPSALGCTLRGMATSAESGSDSSASGDEGASPPESTGSRGRSRRAPPGVEATEAASEGGADATDSDMDLSEDEDEDDQWQQYREVEAAQDDDRDDLEALVPEKRYALPTGVREEARPAAEAPVGDEAPAEGPPPELAAEDAKQRAMAGEMPLMAPDGSRCAAAATAAGCRKSGRFLCTRSCCLCVLEHSA